MPNNDWQATASALRLVPDDAEYGDIAERLHAEFGLRNRRTEAMTQSACVTQEVNSFGQLGTKICALVEIALEGAREDVKEQQAIQTFLHSIPDTLSHEVLEGGN